MSEEEITEYTKYEQARILGSRALQIAMGAPMLIKLTDADLKKISYNPIEIAKLEFEKGLIPITVKRPMPIPLVEDDEELERPELRQAEASEESEAS